MATITGFTSARMLAMEADTIISGTVTGDNLILTKKGGGTVNAGNVRGATGAQGIQGPGPNPSGTFIYGGWTVDPSGYLILDGRLIAGGVATYPTVASLFPGWVSGANLQLPNGLGTVPLVTSGTPGVVSGAMTHTLAAANLPPHAHTMADHTHNTPNHAHTMNHGHTAGSGFVSDDHAHQIPNHQHSDSGGNGAGLGYGYRDPSGPNIGADIYNAGSTFITWVQYPATTFSGGGGWTGGINQNHTHTITVNAFNGTTSVDGSGTSAGMNTSPSTGNGPGTTTAVDHTPKNLSCRVAVKT